MSKLCVVCEKAPVSSRGVTCGSACAQVKRSRTYLSEPQTTQKAPALPAIAPEQEYALVTENKRLKAKIKDLTERLSVDTEIGSFIHSVMTAPVGEIPAWVFEHKTGHRDSAIPTAMLSDTHFGEKVFPEQVEYLNGYNREIASIRLKNFFTNTVVLSRKFLAGLDYPGIVMPLGGDLFSGDIHEELKETNEGSLYEELLYWIDPMVSGIKMFADEFGRVFLPCVVGNHPRNSKKPQAKNRVPNNGDWLFYCLLRKLLAGDDRISWRIPSSADCDYRVYNTRYRLTHGDQFRGGSGIAGLMSPLMIGDARKRKRSQDTNNPYDYLVMGHWHQRMAFKNIIVSGALKGMDEYAMLGNFGYEKPVQNFWLTDKKHGITIEAPIHVLGKNEPWMKAKTQATDQDWIR